jgi:uncharacterized membrane protein YphA (DoxX/SURF4 family)
MLGNMPPRADANTRAIVVLRVMVGAFFVLFGQYKVFGTEFVQQGFAATIQAFLAQHANYPFMAAVLQHTVLPHARLCACLTGYGELLIGLALVFGVLTRVASGFGILLMLLLWFSAGYPGPDVALWRYFGASLDWSVFIACFIAFLIGAPEQQWSLVPRLRARIGQRRNTTSA